MNINRFQNSSPGLRRVAIKLLQAVALALVVTLAMPAAVAEDRAVRSRVAPIYPEIAKRMRASGTVSIEATVDPSGNVSDAKATGGNRLLAPAAEDAVQMEIRVRSRNNQSYSGGQLRTSSMTGNRSRRCETVLRCFVPIPVGINIPQLWHFLNLSPTQMTGRDNQLCRVLGAAMIRPQHPISRVHPIQAAIL